MFLLILHNIYNFGTHSKPIFAVMYRSITILQLATRSPVIGIYYTISIHLYLHIINQSKINQQS